MARMTEILKENLEFYCDTYYQSIEGAVAICSGLYIAITGVITWLIKNMLLRSFYFREAGINGTGGEEVMDYIASKMGRSIWDKYTLIILFECVILWLCIFILYRGVKNYDIYKKRWLVTLIPIAVTVIELGILYYFFIQDMGLVEISLSQWKLICEFVLLFLVALPQILSGRLLMTLEMRKAEEPILLMLLECLTNWVLEKL